MNIVKFGNNFYNQTVTRRVEAEVPNPEKGLLQPKTIYRATDKTASIQDIVTRADNERELVSGGIVEVQYRLGALAQIQAAGFEMVRQQTERTNELLGQVVTALKGQ